METLRRLLLTPLVTVVAALAVSGIADADPGSLWILDRSVPMGASDSVRVSSLSGDGRWAALAGVSSTLVPACADGAAHAFLLDTTSGTVTCVDRAGGGSGAAGNAPAGSVAISGDGNFVAFDSAATNLLAADRNAMRDVFVWSRLTGALELVSITSSGALSSGASSDPSLSSDGQLVAFDSVGALAPPASGTVTNVFLRDRQLQTTQLLSGTIAPNLVPNPGIETSPSASYYTRGAGTFSWATDQSHSPGHSLKIVSAQPVNALARWMTNTDAIRVTAGSTYTVSAWLKARGVVQSGVLAATFWNASYGYLGATLTSSGTVSGTQDWTRVSLTGVAPASSAFMRVELRLNGPGTLWADDLAASSGSGGGEAGGTAPSLSANGNIVAFSTRSPLIVPGLTTPEDSIVTLDRSSGAFQKIVTRNPTDYGPYRYRIGGRATISADGSRVAYTGGLGPWTNALLFDRPTGTLVANSWDGGIADELWGRSGRFDFDMGPPSADGSRVAFTEGTNGSVVFVRDIANHTWELVPGLSSGGLSLSADGQTVVTVGYTADFLGGPVIVYRRDPAASATAAVPPTITGTAKVGLPLTGTLGSWTGQPSRFFYEWSSCAPDGTGCLRRERLSTFDRVVLGPLGQVDPYVVRPEDVGRRIRLRVAAQTNFAITETDAALTSVVTGAALPNLVPNADVEADPASSYYTHGAATFSWATDLSNSPSHSLKIVSAQPLDTVSRWMTNLTAIPVTPGYSYAVSAWLSAFAITQQGLVSVSFWNSAFGYLGTTLDSTNAVTANRYWTHVSLVGVAPAASAYMRVEARLVGPGTLYADDLVVNDVTALVAAVPLNTSLPAITGTAQQGQTLAVSTGTWVNSPISYGYQWVRCDTAGGGCTDISGATAQQYVLAAADVGSTLRMRVTASNTTGPVSTDSAVTSVVTGLPTVVNLAPDPDFELNPASAYYTNGVAVFTWATDQSYSSGHSLKIVSTQAANVLTRWMTNTDAIRVVPGRSYGVSAWLLANAVTQSGVVAATFWNSTYTYLGTTLTSAGQVTGNQDWTQLGLTGIAPTGSAFMRIELRLSGAGTLWTDDLTVSSS